MFNDYADQAGYYDLCLIIYHTADYHNSTTIAGTWTNLIYETHEEVTARIDAPGAHLETNPQPYEVVSTKVQGIAHSTSLDSFVFPIQMLIPELCKYAVAYQQDANIGADPTWPVQLFLTLGVSHDMITRVLENVLDAQDYGFVGPLRSRLVELIVYVVNDWVAEVRRRGGAGKGSAIGPSVGELLGRCMEALPPAGQGHNNGGADLSDVRRVLRTLSREVAGLVERVPTGSLRFQ